MSGAAAAGRLALRRAARAWGAATAAACRKAPAGFRVALAPLLPLALLALSVAGCSSAPPPAAAAPGLAPWELPQAELSTQRLLRVHYSGPRGEGSFRLTLRLDRPDRYQLTAVDPAGRRIWTLAVEGQGGLWLDHRAERFCSLGGEVELEAVPLGPFALSALPAVLLGRLPAQPAAGSGPIRLEDGRLELTDAAGRRWQVGSAGGILTSWTLWEAGEPAAWWSRHGDEAVLSQRRDQIQLRWREVVREELSRLPTVEAPPAYLEGCEGVAGSGGI